MKNMHKIFILMLLVLFIGQSCSDDFLDRGPKDSPSPNNFFYGEETAMQAALAGMSRIQFHQSASVAMRGGAYINNFDLMTDDQYARSNKANWYGWDVTTTNSNVRKYWESYYKVIASSNFAIENIPTSSDPDYGSEEQKKAIAVARFIRAWAYSNVAVLWSNSPLVTKLLKTRDEYYQPNNSADSIYLQMIEDLEYAGTNLPDAWPNYSSAPTNAAGDAFLARANIYYANYIKYGDGTGDASKYFQKAASVAETAIAQAAAEGIVLRDKYEDFWLAKNEPNPEIIWAFEFAEGQPGYGTRDPWIRAVRDINKEFKGVNGSGWGYCLPQRDLYDEYESDDPRRGYTIYAPGDFYGIYHGPTTDPIDYWYIDENTGDTTHTQKSYADGDTVLYNYKWSPSGMNTRKTDNNSELSFDQSGIDIIMSRLAEVYLIAAEAYAELDDVTNALKYVNIVRARGDVNLPPRSLGDGRKGDGSIVNIVRHERRVELALEGYRLFDMARWGLLKTYKQRGENHEIPRYFYYNLLTESNEAKWDIPYGVPGPGLWPIPQKEIDNNEALTDADQNPGYN